MAGPLEACKNHMKEKLLSGKRFHEDNELEYVYCTVSDAFPGMVRIGCTNPEVGASTSRGRTGPQRVKAVATTFHSARDKELAHVFFRDQRTEGELFSVTPSTVQTFFDRLITPAFEEELKETAELSGWGVDKTWKEQIMCCDH